VAAELTQSPRSARQRIPPVARIGALVVGLGLVFVGARALQNSSAAPLALRVGSAAPGFTLQDTSDRSVSLAAYRGRPVILNFWATWCPPCRAEMPAINAVAAANPQVAVLAVDVLEGPALVAPFARELNLGFVPLLDTTGEVAGRYRVSSLPSSFFIGPDGTIRAINVGPLDQPAIEQNLRRAS
jgi:cytochrome c biogenesis protein CcmG, thiol:disulfide interchange protein DsbE